MALTVVLLLEVLLGILSVYNQLPIGLVTLHNTIAALMLLACVNLVNHLTVCVDYRSGLGQGRVETGS